jgi:hypothetical protein
MHFLNHCLLLSLLAGLLGCTPHPTAAVRVEARKTAKGEQYALFYPENLALQVTTTRPDPAQNDCFLSVAAAYTDLATYQPLDLLAYRGTIRQPKAQVGFLDGQLTIIGPTVTISQIARGQSPSRAQLEQVRSQQGTLLLQELVVFRGKNQRPAGGAVFQRRALVEFAGHRLAVVESTSDYLTMQQFGDDLVELGAQNALYLDMGDWDEGWYKAGSSVVKTGNRRTQTARQSNWLVFVSPASSPVRQRTR